MRRTMISTAVLALLCSMPLGAQAEAAETREQAQQFLLAMLESGAIHFTIGNTINDGQVGLVAEVDSTINRYRKKVRGGWEFQSSTAQRHWVELEVSKFSNQGGPDGIDQCATTAGHVVAKNAFGPIDFSFPADGLVKERMYGDKDRSVFILDQDPRQLFSGPYVIDWRRATFSRFRDAKGDPRGPTRFLIKTGSRTPDAQITVHGDALADYVENAIRVLRLSCQP